MGRRLVVLSVALAGVLLFAAPLPIAVAETSTGCPAGYQFRSVESLAATGNAPVPGQVDAAGNADGFVCALPLPDAVCTARASTHVLWRRSTCSATTTCPDANGQPRRRLRAEHGPAGNRKVVCSARGHQTRR